MCSDQQGELVIRSWELQAFNILLLSGVNCDNIVNFAWAQSLKQRI